MGQDAHVAGGSGATARRSPTADSRLLRTELGRRLGRESLATLTSGSPERSLARGDVLVAQGDEAHLVYLVAQGRLDVTVATGAGEHHVATLGPGAVVGEIALLSGDRRSTTVRARTRALVVEVAAERLQALLAAEPEYAAQLAAVASQRLHRTLFARELTALFGTLPGEVLDAVEDLIEWVTLAAGDELFTEGDPGDAAYLVVTGRLRVTRAGQGASADPVERAELGRGEMVGEMALLEDVPRNASVHAVRDTQLARFTRDAYTTLLERHPGAGLVIARTVVRRSHAAPERGSARPLSLLVVPAGGDDMADEVVAGLVRALGPNVRVVSSADVDAALGGIGQAQVGDDDVRAIRLAYWLDELQRGDDFVIFRLDEDWTPWSRRALRWSDHVLVVADVTTDPEPGPRELELHRLLTCHPHPKVSLALVHPTETELPSGTRLWTDGRPLSSHHHIRRDDESTVRRLARLLSGQATSLVLGGGGARGFAHLGVCSVLEAEGLEIDLVGGTSIGAVMGAAVALGWPSARARSTLVDAFRDLFDYTVPTVSLLRGERITRKLRSFLGELDIADLWVPYFCLSTNLTTAGPHVHERGDLVAAIRASIAIPGVLPPVPLDGELLVDGGVLDNVPVEEMRRRNPTGRILAIDVAPAEGPAAPHDYGLSAGGLASWRARRRGRPAPPSLLTTMVRASLIAAVRDRDRVVREGIADLYVDLTVEGGGMLDFSAAEQIADAGAAGAAPVLRAWLNGGADALGRYVKTEPAPRLPPNG